MKGKSTLFLIITAIAISLGFASAFFVDEREKAIVFKFGEIVNADLEPGLHFKIPFINNVQYFDARVQTMDADPELYLTGEKKNLVVDSFVKWRIRDVHQYYTRLQGRQQRDVSAPGPVAPRPQYFPAKQPPVGLLRHRPVHRRAGR